MRNDRLLFSAALAALFVAVLAFPSCAGENDSGAPSHENNVMWLVAEGDYPQFNCHSKFSKEECLAGGKPYAPGILKCDWDFPLEPALSPDQTLYLDRSKEIFVWMEYSTPFFYHMGITITISIGDTLIGTDTARIGDVESSIIALYYSPPMEKISGAMGNINVNVEFSGLDAPKDTISIYPAIQKVKVVWPFAQNLLEIEAEGGIPALVAGRNTFNITAFNPTDSAISTKLVAAVNVTRGTAQAGNESDAGAPIEAQGEWRLEFSNETIEVGPGKSLSITCAIDVPENATIGDFADIIITGAKRPLQMRAEVGEERISLAGSKEAPGFEGAPLLAGLAIIALLFSLRRR